MESGDEVPQNQFYNSDSRKNICHKKSLECIRKRYQGKTEVYEDLGETPLTRSNTRMQYIQY